jgi:aminocarboxymuconate-semialdehyde decarboxylase
MIDAKNYRAVSAAARHRPTAQARQFFYDTLVFDEATLKHLVHCFGDTQLMIGTDYPFNFHDDQPVARLEAASLTPEALQRMTEGNAGRFLGLPIPTPMPATTTTTTPPTTNPRPPTT